ncbi:TMEM43 family protein [Gimesia aquarii]|uniref:Uncharacterized protein n=1 Tax=Gimesia aquarii TaxID=2527964 RepID=A0A517WZJ2_9PLAN|nr:TMEM43 family protein [Gimesia aquarii]QDU10664.1 hypothetical protein V202x_40760 [Gimesia aquarii]
MNQKSEETVENSFGTRFKIALKNLGIGIVFVIAGLFLLWHNETNNLEHEISIAQAESVLSENQETTPDKQENETTEDSHLSKATVLIWGFRLASWIILFLGLATLFKPLVVLVEKIPLLGNFVGRGITVFALLSSLSLSLILVSAVWMVARPVYGAVLLLLGVVPLLILYRSGKRGRLKHALKQT